jgi:hypothetical protein
MKQRWLTVLLVSLTATALSASVAFAGGPTGTNGGLAVAAGHAQGKAPTSAGCNHASGGEVSAARGKPADTGKPAGVGKPTEVDPADDEGGSEEVDTDHERPQNHGWFVSQVAKDHSVTGRAHGEAVSAVAQSDQGKPEQASH